MAFSGFLAEIARFPDSLLPRLVGAQDRILLGTDFPNIPYPYLHQLEALAKLDFGASWLRSVCWQNPARLFGVR